MTQLEKALRHIISITTEVEAELTVETEVKMRKKHPETGAENPYAGRVTKRRDVSGWLCADLKTRVNQILAEQGADPTYEPGERKWGKRLLNGGKPTPLVEHLGNYYLSVVLEDLPAGVYLLDGEPVARKVMANLRPYLQEREEALPLPVRDYKFETIKRLTVNGAVLIGRRKPGRKRMLAMIDLVEVDEAGEGVLPGELLYLSPPANAAAEDDSGLEAEGPVWMSDPETRTVCSRTGQEFRVPKRCKLMRLDLAGPTGATAGATAGARPETAATA